MSDPTAPPPLPPSAPTIDLSAESGMGLGEGVLIAVVGIAGAIYLARKFFPGRKGGGCAGCGKSGCSTAGPGAGTP